MSDYNGWTNYATWVVVLEILDDYISSQDDARLAEMSVSDCADHLSDYVDDVLTHFGELDESRYDPTLAYARAFVSDVDWRSCAEHAQESVREMFPPDEEELDEMAHALRAGDL